ncbi:MAG: hypothetical protein ABGZ49_08740 [Akkermansiaceae bacterium]|nr:hypothetical protein [Roseibacillus sp.]
MNGKSHDPGRSLVEASAECAPAVLGVAAGIILGDLMHRGARRPVGFALAVLGAAAIAPVIVDSVREKVAGPNTRRGTQRTLRSIRDGAGMPARDIDYVKEELGEI